VVERTEVALEFFVARKPLTEPIESLWQTSLTVRSALLLGGEPFAVSLMPLIVFSWDVVVRVARCQPQPCFGTQHQDAVVCFT
jgi:hypothetical protein